MIPLISVLNVFKVEIISTTNFTTGPEYYNDMIIKMIDIFNTFLGMNCKTSRQGNCDGRVIVVKKATDIE
jgi:hypothetical protein